MIWIKVPLTESEKDANDHCDDAAVVPEKDVNNNNNDDGEKGGSEGDDRIQVREMGERDGTTLLFVALRCDNSISTSTSRLLSEVLLGMVQGAPHIVRSLRKDRSLSG